MAYTGFCSNEQIIKAIQKKFQHLVTYFVSPEMVFLEEYIMFLKESAVFEGLSKTYILDISQQKYQQLSKLEKMRYVKLACEINAEIDNGLF